LLVQRPEEIIDFTVGLASWESYKNELKKLVTLNHPMRVIAVNINNASKVRSYLGEEKYNSHISAFAELIEKYVLKKHGYGELYYEAPHMIYVVLERSSKIDVEKSLKELTNNLNEVDGDVKDSGINLDIRLCVINYPDDVEKYEDIIQLGHDFKYMLSGDKSVVYAEDIIKTDKYIIGSQLDNILNRAIINRSFEMYYQPIYSISKQTFNSAEALIRLKDEKYGYISPALFIPYAERRGLILAIGDLVLEMVYKFISENDIEALGLAYIEINLSVAQCMQKGLPKKIELLQQKYGVDPKKINFEILETTYDDVGMLATYNIQEIAKMGYSFALDDYGTGYSNINRMLSLPINIVKIDKSLVDSMGQNYGNEVISSTISMINKIGKETVIEGVEDKYKYNQLIEMGCDHIQGFIFTKPLCQEEFISYLKKHLFS